MINQNSHAYVRQEMLEAQPAPIVERSIFRWFRDNLFATPMDVCLTVVNLLLLFYVLPSLVEWLLVNAVWIGEDRSVCTTIAQGGIQANDWSGACWAFVNAKMKFFITGYYPDSELWRVYVVFATFIALLVPLAIPKMPYKGYNIFLLCIAFPIISFFLLCGSDILGLQTVATEEWGGIMVTLIISFVGIAIALPLGIMLALGRCSKMPAIRMLSVVFIEFVRGIPLITVLFVANIVLPLFLPSGMTFDQLLRVLIGVGLFSAAYVAEVVRGGLQGVSKGQYEGTCSLGLNYVQAMLLIILPQALRRSIPGIVNTFISLFKDTTLIYTISMFDLLGIVRQHFADTDWISSQTATSGLVFAGIIFWVFCFGISRYSAFMERYLYTGRR